MVHDESIRCTRAGQEQWYVGHYSHIERHHLLSNSMTFTQHIMDHSPCMVLKYPYH